MKIFISWSGKRSRYLADCLHGWLPRVIQSIRPWMSSEDIRAGSRWLNEVAKELNESKAGLICVTPENQANPWLLFEAGALSKTMDQTFVCPLLYEMTYSQMALPLSQFHALQFERASIHRLLVNLNSANTSGFQLAREDLDESFSVWWPKLEKQLKETPSVDSGAVPKRETGEILEEILDNTREQLRRENLRLEQLRASTSQLADTFPVLERMDFAMQSVKERNEKLLTQGPLKDAIEKVMAIPPEEIAKLGAPPNLPTMSDMLPALKRMHQDMKSFHEKILSPKDVDLPKGDEGDGSTNP